MIENCQDPPCSKLCYANFDSEEAVEEVVVRVRGVLVECTLPPISDKDV